jgi:hypothetical protein
MKIPISRCASSAARTACALAVATPWTARRPFSAASFADESAAR